MVTFEYSSLKATAPISPPCRDWRMEQIESSGSFEVSRVRD